MHTTPLLAADALTVFGIVGLGVVAVIGLILLIMIGGSVWILGDLYNRM